MVFKYCSLFEIVMPLNIFSFIYFNFDLFEQFQLSLDQGWIFDPTCIEAIYSII